MKRRTRAALFSGAMILLLPLLAHAAPNEFDKVRAQGWLWAYLVAFGTGVFTSLTPCVYPMIPIVVGIFGAKDVSKLRAFFLASMYVLGMGVMFAALGMLAALSGHAMGSILANPYVVIPIVLLYVALAASLFGAFELNLPSALQAKLSTVGGKGTGGAFAMGMVGGLTAAPCTGPFLGGLLAYVATRGNVLLGGSLLFVYACGIGVLFWLIATFSMSMPKSGRWMELIKVIGGVGLLVVGAYFLRPIWPALARLTSPRFLFLASSLGVVLVGVGLLIGYMVVGGEGAAAKGMKFGAIGFAVIGAVGVVNWSQTPKHPLPWRHDEVAACAEAKATGRNVLVDFGAEWCKPCKKIETEVFSDPSVYAELNQRYVPLKIDVTNENEAVLDAKKRWGQNDVLPTVILAGPDCKERRRFQEIMSPDEFLQGARAVQ